MKISNDTIGNQTRDLPACSLVPEPTACPCGPHSFSENNHRNSHHCSHKYRVPGWCVSKIENLSQKWF